MTHKSTLHACEFGIVTQAIVNNLTPLLFVIFKDNFGISYTLIGALMLLNFTVQLLTDALAINLVNRIGYRKSGILAQAVAALGLVFLSLLPKLMPIYPALLTATVFLAFGGGLLEVMVSPIVDSLDIGHSSARMSMLHSFYCWGQLAVVLLSTTLLKIAVLWWLLPILWAIVPLFNIFLFMAVPIPKIPEEASKTGIKSLFSSRIFYIMCILMLCSGAAEITMSQWASLFAQKGLDIDKFSGDIQGPCLFALFMGLGRLLQGLFGGRISLDKSLVFCSGLCIICYLGAALSQNAYIALLFCAVTGFSVSIMWPGVYSYSSKLIKNGGPAMFGVLAMFGDIGCSIGSWLCGTVSDFTGSILANANIASAEQIGLKTGIGITAVFPIIMLIFLILTNRKGRLKL